MMISRLWARPPRVAARAVRLCHKGYAPETVSIHGDSSCIPSGAEGGGGVYENSVAPPISTSTTYLADVHVDGYVYGRDTAPTRTRCEKIISELEGGSAVLYSSGLAATFATLFHLNPKRIAIRGGYHGTHNVAKLFHEKLNAGIIDLDDPIGPGDVIWVETPRNPMCEVYDIEMYAQTASSKGAYLVVDATMAPPPLQFALRLGADIVVHSATKYYAGHSDALCGVAVARDPNVGQKLLSERSSLGSPPGNLESWLLLRSLRTLHIRVKRQTETAQKFAEWLDSKEGGRAHGVLKVYYPSLASHPSHEVASRQMKGGYGGVLSIELESERAAKSLPGVLNLMRDATSLGGVESLIEWRRKYDDQVPPELLRISVGLEDVNDLIADFKSALIKVK